MSVNRRSFLKTSAVASAAAVLPAHGMLAAQSSDDIRVGVIGLKGRGRDHFRGLKRHIVALCDVDQEVLAGSAKAFDRKVSQHVDFRELLDRKDIDAVSIATPNHWHSLIGILAAQSGKDVYVEKPVSHTVWEGRQLVNAARKNDRIIQCGTQSRSSPSLHEAVKFVRDGHLGKIEYAIGTCYKPRGSIGKLDKPLQIPSHVDYNLWCGPAAMVDLYRPKLHYDWHWDFNTGNGDMGNQGIHQMDIARWFLGESMISPRVMSIGGRLGYEDAGNTPNTQIVYHDYEKAPLIFETRGLRRAKGVREMDVYRGSKIGVIVQCSDGYVVIPSYTSATAYDKDGQKIKAWNGGGDHYQNFLAAVRSRNPGDLNAEILDGHLSSALCHTGNISHRVGEKQRSADIRQEVKSDSRLADSFDRMAKHLDANEVDVDSRSITLGSWLEMDPATERFTNSEAANELLHRKDRRPFVVPEITV